MDENIYRTIAEIEELMTGPGFHSREWEVLKLRYLSGGTDVKSYQSIGEELGIAANTARRWRNQAVMNLRQYYQVEGSLIFN